MAYNACNAIILEFDPELSAAEAHGMATGMLCINEHADSASWLNELKANSTSSTNTDDSTLVHLFDETQRLLSIDDYEYDLFLPDDDHDLSTQTEALKNWCRGFLYSMGAISSNKHYSEDVLEILKDISEFTKLDTQVEGEEDEAAFVELTEYLRSAVFLLRAELIPTSNNFNA